jgi:hypothetical protein
MIKNPVGVVCGVVGAAIFCWLAVFTWNLEVSNYDSYSYMSMARYNAGFKYFLEPEINTRPPLLPFLLTPLASLHHLGVSNHTVFRLMHGFALILSFAFLLACHCLFKRLLRPEFAALGVLLIMIQPGFLAYAFEPMVDLPCALLMTLATILYLRYREQPSVRLLTGICLLLGLGTAMKHILIVGPVILCCAEAVIAGTEGKSLRQIVQRKFFWQVPLLFLGFYALASIVSTAPMFGWTWHTVLRTVQPFAIFAGKNAQWQVDPTANFSFLEEEMTPGPLYLMLAGLVFCLREKEPRSLVMWSWLAVYLFFITLANRYYQYRYLFPVIPACYYFFLYALQRFADGAEARWGNADYFRWVRVAVLMVICFVPAANLAREIQSLSGKPFHENFERRFAARVAELTTSPGVKLFWLGQFYPIYQDGDDLHPKDEYYKIYHYGLNGLSFFSDRYFNGIPSISFNGITIISDYENSRAMRDGDVMVYSAVPMISRQWYSPLPLDLQPLRVGKVGRKVLPLVDQSQNVKTFADKDGRSRMVLTFHDPDTLEVDREDVGSSAPSSFLWFKRRGDERGLGEEVLFFFNDNRPKRELHSLTKDYFDQIEEVTELSYDAEEFHLER